MKYKTAAAEIEAAEKRLENFHRQGREVSRRYRGEMTGNMSTACKSPLNVFHSNVTVLENMLFAKVPQAQVDRAHYDANDNEARAAADILQRMLNTDLEYDNSDFAGAMRNSLHDRLTAGLGTARIRYEPITATTKTAIQNEETGEIEEAEREILVTELAPVDYVHWQDFLWGFGRTWSEVPWVAFRHYLTKAEFKAQFPDVPKDAVDQLNFKKREPREKESSQHERDSRDTVEVQEMWVKAAGEVYWLADGFEDGFVKKADDPLRLRNFFPCPEPMLANPSTEVFTPKSDYMMHQTLYMAVDMLETRILALTRGVKNVGVRDATAAGVERMLQEGMDNDLVPVDNWGMFAEKGGLSAVIEWLPKEETAKTIAILSEQRDNTLALLAQMTGRSDIERGMTGNVRGGQPESATAQALKAQYASISVQALQERYATFGSELQTLKAEIICQHFDDRTIATQSNIMRSANAEGAMAALQMLRQPTWPWRVEIKSESMAMIDKAKVREERTGFLMATATYIQSAQAMIQAAPETTSALFQLLKINLAGYPGAKDMEAVLDKLLEVLEQKAQQPQQGENPEAVKLQAQREKMQHEQRMLQAKTMAELHKEEMKEATKAANEIKKMFANLQKDLIKLREETEAKIRIDAANAAGNIAEAKIKANLQKAAGGSAPRTQ